MAGAADAVGGGAPEAGAPEAGAPEAEAAELGAPVVGAVAGAVGRGGGARDAEADAGGGALGAPVVGAVAGAVGRGGGGGAPDADAAEADAGGGALGGAPVVGAVAGAVAVAGAADAVGGGAPRPEAEAAGAVVVCVAGEPVAVAGADAAVAPAAVVACSAICEQDWRKLLLWHFGPQHTRMRPCSSMARQGQRLVHRARHRQAPITPASGSEAAPMCRATTSSLGTDQPAGRPKPHAFRWIACCCVNDKGRAIVTCEHQPNNNTDVTQGLRAQGLLCSAVSLRAYRDLHMVMRYEERKEATKEMGMV